MNDCCNYCKYYYDKICKLYDIIVIRSDIEYCDDFRSKSKKKKRIFKNIKPKERKLK